MSMTIDIIVSLLAVETYGTSLGLSYFCIRPEAGSNHIGLSLALSYRNALGLLSLLFQARVNSNGIFPAGMSHAIVRLSVDHKTQCYVISGGYRNKAMGGAVILEGRHISEA